MNRLISLQLSGYRQVSHIHDIETMAITVAGQVCAATVPVQARTKCGQVSDKARYNRFSKININDRQGTKMEFPVSHISGQWAIMDL